MRLAIVSHTEHCLVDGRWEGLAPTVREIRHLVPLFDKIYHAACAYDDLPDRQTLAYGDGVEFVPLPPSGGSGLRAKLGILANAPRIAKTVLRVVQQADVVQLRLPTSMGLYLLPVLKLSRHDRSLWMKYAGNWNQKSAPLSYAIQRWWSQSCQTQPVTVNGVWDGAPAHIIAFENPCLTDDEISTAAAAANSRAVALPLEFCFVGRLEESKGLGRILSGLARLRTKNAIGRVHFVGDGPDRAEWESAAAVTGIPCIFHGSLGREELAGIYAASHYLLLPSESEGFPKVVAEAAAFGVVPIVSAVSAIPQYIDCENGFLWPVDEEFSNWFESLPLFDLDLLRSKSEEIRKLARLFTYSRYREKLQTDIFPLLR